MASVIRDGSFQYPLRIVIPKSLRNDPGTNDIVFSIISQWWQANEISGQWNILYSMSEHVRLITTTRFVSFGRWRIQFSESVLVRFVLFASVADTFHVFLLSHMFWHFLIYGRSIGFLVLTWLPWSFSLSSLHPQYWLYLHQGTIGISPSLLVPQLQFWESQISFTVAVSTTFHPIFVHDLYKLIFLF